ncbi:hypothetical protein M8R20_31675 [Pseudomonas sp. R2.Fl]|nr:hypothetical protein [Pseudomonas sp. R2.Fl]
MPKFASVLMLGFSSVVLLTACSSTPRTTSKSSEDRAVRIERMAEQNRRDEIRRVAQARDQMRREQGLERLSVKKSDPP